MNANSSLDWCCASCLSTLRSVFSVILVSRVFSIALIGAIHFCSVQNSNATSATWSGAVSGEWNNGNNWQEMSFPNGLLETATFGDSAQPAVFISSPITLLGLTFDPGMTSYTIDVGSTGLTFSGAIPGLGGIHNDSGVAQNFVVSAAENHTGAIIFTNDAAAGDSSNTIFTLNGGGFAAVPAGTVNFLHQTSAGHATFNVSGIGNGGNMNFIDDATADHGNFTVNRNGTVRFVDSATAANGTFTVNGTTGPGTGNPGSVVFTADGSPNGGVSTPGDAIFTNNGGAVGNSLGGTVVIFYTAENATFINNGGTASNAGGGLTRFFGDGTGGQGTFINNGGGIVGALGGTTQFEATSSAGNGIFTNGGGAGTRGSTRFLDNATAGNGTFNNNDRGETVFNNNSTAGNGIFINNSGPIGGQTVFNNTSSAAIATYINQGGTVSGDVSGRTTLQNLSTANSATFTSNGASVAGASGGLTAIIGASNAGNSTLIANAGTNGGGGGEIRIFGDASGGTSIVQLHGNGSLDITARSNPVVPIGSLEGDGNVFLGSFNLSVGTNNATTTFSGVIQDGGLIGGTGGSLTKVGAGTLTLAGANTYTGATTVNGGSLIITGSIASAVTLNGGTLGGSGMIGGITVNGGGTLSPGDSPGILNVSGNLTLTMGSTYLVDLNGTAVGTGYDQTHVTGTVDLGDATLSVSLGFTPGPGVSFAIIDNDGKGAVIGTFNGLAEGAAFTAGGQTFAISYLGGDGNDVVVTALIPEPETWVLVGVGAAVIGYLCRRRRTSRS